MPPKKGTKAYREEMIYAHYGIDRDTLEVKSVWERRDGALYNGNMTHHVLRGRDARSELAIVFNLGDIKTVPVHQVGDPLSERIHEELKALAEQRRAERDNRSKGD